MCTLEIAQIVVAWLGCVTKCQKAWGGNCKRLVPGSRSSARREPGMLRCVLGALKQLLSMKICS